MNNIFFDKFLAIIYFSRSNYLFFEEKGRAKMVFSVSCWHLLFAARKRVSKLLQHRIETELPPLVKDSQPVISWKG